jgi:hypothetical protein
MCLVSPWMDNGHIVAFLKKEVCDTDHLLSIVSLWDFDGRLDMISAPQILDVALGLKDLHDKGIVHGDLTEVCASLSGFCCPHFVLA